MPDLADSGSVPDRTDGSGAETGTGTTAEPRRLVTEQRATEPASPTGRHDEAATAERIGLALLNRYERSGQGSMLVLAVDALRTAVTVLPADDPAQAECLHNLALALHLTAVSTGDGETAAEAIRTFRAALAAGPTDFSHRATILAALSTALRISWIGTEDDAELAEAVTLARDAVRHADAADSADGADTIRLSARHCLCLALEAAGTAAGDPNLLAEAVEVGHRMVAQAPADDPDRGKQLAALGSALRALFVHTGDPAAAAEASRVLAEAGAIRTAAPAVRINALRDAAVVAGWAGTAPEEVLALVEEAVRLLPQSPGPSPAPADQTRRLGLVDSLAGVAAASAVAAGRPLRAVELLEQTRGVLLDDTVRSWDGGTGLGAAPDVRALAARTAGVPVVFVVSSPLGSHALIVTDDRDTPVRVTPLPDLSDDDVVPSIIKLTNGYLTVIDPPDGHPFRAMIGESMLLSVFRWMWDAIAEPVLHALGHVGPPAPGEAWPRVRWCPTGMLAHLPLHAAGHHTDISTTLADRPDRLANPRTVLDRVVSSYVPGLRGLARTGDHGAPTDPTMLIVSVPDAPGVPRLHGAIAEATVLTELVPSSRTIPVAGRRSVLTALPAFHVAHFICHGVTDWDDPASSHLVLAEGRDGRLTVTDLGRLRLAGGLAYLSACATMIPAVATPDEGVHLTSAFHLAGYRHVVGTLWPVNDFVARGITESFYRYLTADGTSPPDVSRSAVALHLAVRRTRERHLTSPTLWAAHTHTGF
ncbi:CHAT domain-containing protein [Parafrankia sp. EUN1f]|uniref:CHAT domain-containing protein n=1 Tax=Parafrankia sp. EUN1f TaxID=102897 RepID=UPI0001C43E31|nr:CHAT domain-containing protein [Parafrankia sp. EUN1f]EFC85482.1 conserved hypothetical protein [Parafrankia sp. EUN1f]